MISCKVCGTEIAKNAKVCPACGAKNSKPIFKRVWFWLIIIVIILAIIGALGGGDSSSPSQDGSGGNTQQDDISSDDQGETIYSVGDTITTEKFEITVISVEEKDSVGSQYSSSTPAEGGTYVAVAFEYKNITNEPIGMFSFPSVKLQDSNDVKYSSDISASTYYATEINPDSKVLSDLNPGIKVTDAEVFEISKESYANSGWNLIIDADEDISIKIK